MNLRRIAVLSATALMVLGNTAVEARPGHGGHHHFGRAFVYVAPVFAGAYFASRYYYPPDYYYPPSPPVYIEQPAPYAVPPQSQVPPQAQPQSQAYWYYCASSRAYYPHVQTCSSGWQRVAPQPPPG